MFDYKISLILGHIFLLQCLQGKSYVIADNQVSIVNTNPAKIFLLGINLVYTYVSITINNT